MKNEQIIKIILILLIFYILFNSLKKNKVEKFGEEHCGRYIPMYMFFFNNKNKICKDSKMKKDFINAMRTANLPLKCSESTTTTTLKPKAIEDAKAESETQKHVEEVATVETKEVVKDAKAESETQKDVEKVDEEEVVEEEVVKDAKAEKEDEIYYMLEKSWFDTYYNKTERKFYKLGKEDWLTKSNNKL